MPLTVGDCRAKAAMALPILEDDDLPPDLTSLPLSEARGRARPSPPTSAFFLTCSLLRLDLFTYFIAQMTRTNQISYLGPSVIDGIVDGRSALHICSIVGFDESASVLLALGADVERLTKPENQSALFMAEEGGHDVCVEIIREGGRKREKGEEKKERKAFLEEYDVD